MDEITITEAAAPVEPVAIVKTKIYNYDGKTGLYMGESWADDSPLEPGFVLMPRHSTDVAPPDDVPEGSALFWRGLTWETEAVPVQDDDLDGLQDAPAGFATDAQKPGYFKRLVRALVGK